MKIDFYNDKIFIVSILWLITSLFYFQTKKLKLSLFLLYLSSLFLGYFMIRLDPFLWIWDEQYHALVAKNMLEFPLKPLLIKNPVFGINYLEWSSSHIWMHKQPLFLWQISVSLKLFGINEISVRIPSLIMYSLIVLLIFRVAKILINETVGYYSAFFFTCAYFPLEYLTGFYPTDHNDFSFFFYSFASIWALLEYFKSQKNIFVLLIGLLAGCAILCKWLTGLVVFEAWIVLIITNKKFRDKKEILNFLKSLLTCLGVFLPWQIYAKLHYPIEYNISMNFNVKHVTQALEGHGGDYFFYYTALYEQFGEGLLVPILTLLCLTFMLIKIKNQSSRLVILTVVISLYLFFTIVSTKMYGYVFVAFPFVIIGIAYVQYLFIENLLSKYTNSTFKKLSESILILILAMFFFNSGKIFKHHSNKERELTRSLKKAEKEMFISIKNKYGLQNMMIFNCRTSLNSHIPSMFYTGYPTFDFVLTENQIKEIKKSNYKLIAIDDGKLPEYIMKDSNIVKHKLLP